MTQGSANAKSGQASAGGNTIRYTVTRPDVTRLAANFQANLAARFAQVAQTFQHSAQAAYAGTRFAGTFTVASTWHSVTLVQTNELFRVVESRRKSMTSSRMTLSITGLCSRSMDGGCGLSASITPAPRGDW